MSSHFGGAWKVFVCEYSAGSSEKSKIMMTWQELVEHVRDMEKTLAPGSETSMLGDVLALLNAVGGVKSLSVDLLTDPNADVPPWLVRIVDYLYKNYQ